MVTHPSGVLTAIRPALVMILQCNKTDNDFRSHSNSPFELGARLVAGTVNQMGLACFC